MSHGVETNWTSEDRFHIANLTVPVPSNEQKRIEVLRKSKLLDITTNDTGFGRFTSLASRLFNMAYSVVSFVEVERVVFKAKLGIDFTEIGRNDWFDAYTVLPDVSEVYVVPDCLTDARFKDKAYVKGYPKIRFYAGAAIMVDNLKIGVLSIMDTEPHKFFSLEDKENLLDLGAAAAQLAKEKLQTALNLSAERANIVVSMMHHLRTPMTSLNFATSLLCNDVHSIRTDYNGPGAQSTVAGQQPESMMEVESLEAAHEETKETSLQPPQSVFQSFESSFTEISNALNQLNILVDSSLSLGQAIIKCSSNEVAASSSSTNLQAMDPRSRFTECNIIDYLHDMFQNNLPVHNHNLEIEWIVDTNDLVRGTHVTFPDAVMLIVISTVSHMSTESNSLGFHFSFETVDEDDMEYPELISKMLEGRLAIKVFAKDSRPFPGRLDNVSLDTMSTDDNDHVASSSQPVNNNSNNNSNNNGNSPDVLSKQNFLSIDKILRAINGSSREFVDDILLFSTVQHDPSGAGGFTKSNGPCSDVELAEYRTIHEFLVPCKILLNSFADGGRSPNQRQKQLRYFRPSMKYIGASTLSQQSTPIYHNRGGPSSIPVNGEIRVAENDQQQQTPQQQQQQNQQQGSITHGTGIILPAPIVTGVAPIVDAVATGNSSLGADVGTDNSATVDVAKPRPLRVLVVEDTIPVQKLLTRWLQNQGCSVTCASNGKIGLDYLTSQAFDIAFVDFLMPVMLGITTMKLFQQWIVEHPPERASLADENRAVLIVGMSATALESEQEEAFNYGMHFFCPKPVSLELLTIILDAKRSNATNLDDAIDQICDITGTAATDVAMSAGDAAEDDGRSPRAGPLVLQVDAASADVGGEGGNPKNKWTFFRSFRQSRLHSGQGEEDGEGAEEEPQSSGDK